MFRERIVKSQGICSFLFDLSHLENFVSMRLVCSPMDLFQLVLQQFHEVEKAIVALGVDGSVDDTDQSQSEKKDRGQDWRVLDVVGHDISQSDGCQRDECEVECAGRVDSCSLLFKPYQFCFTWHFSFTVIEHPYKESTETEIQGHNRQCNPDRKHNLFEVFLLEVWQLPQLSGRSIFVFQSAYLYFSRKKM